MKRLSDLATGQEAYITGITGEGSIKKRITELGFIAGRKVKAIKAAPLKDPVEYDIMGYKISIRRKDAAMVTIEPVSGFNVDAKSYKVLDWSDDDSADSIQGNGSNNGSKTINVALIGNPNSGKTTIFNYATNSRERVANYSGVTVAAKEATYETNGYKLNIIDLPGTYSLSSYSPEEMYVSDYLTYKKPDVIINIVDSGNLERNLYLTTQLIDTGLKTIVALNMYDELNAGKAKLDYKKLGTLLGMPFVPTVGTKGSGLNELFNTVIDVYTNNDSTVRPVKVPYGEEIENAISKIQDVIAQEKENMPEPSRFFALQLLESDPNICAAVPVEKREKIFGICEEKRQAIEKLLNHDIYTEIVNYRYGFINGALSETYKEEIEETVSLSHKIDSLLTHKLLGLPVFFGIIWFIFYCTFTLGEIPMSWIDSMFGWLGNSIRNILPAGAVNNLIVDGIIGGVGGVIVFLPNIMILFLFISLMEDSGYMARTAFLMDKVMHKAGLHGKSFIPLLMGFGCNVPAIMATRTIESRRDRLVTMFIIPFMSCSARLPVYVLFISAFFPHNRSAILFLMYVIGILAALATALILNKTIFRKTESPFVMELPPYRVPTIKAIGKHTWFRTMYFLKKMGTVILVASVIIWALGYFPQDKNIIGRYDADIAEQKTLLLQVDGKDAEKTDEITNKVFQLETLKQGELLEQSFISRIGRIMEPVFKPLGFDWKMSVSILTGVMAKEVVVSSMGILYHAGAEDASAGLIEKLRTHRLNYNVPLVTYFSFLVFILLYFPCMGTLIAIKKETARYKWMLFSIIYPLSFAWITSFLIFQIGIRI